MLTKDEYEHKINNHRVFEIDETVAPTAYKKEKYALITLLAEYYVNYKLRGRVMDYGYELTVTASQCIKAYKKSRGAFLNLFNMVMKRYLHVEKMREAISDMRAGIHISAQDDAAIRNIMRLIKYKGLDPADANTQEYIADVLGFSVERVRTLLYINATVTVVPDTVEYDDGSKKYVYDEVCSTGGADENVLDECALEERFKQIEQWFLSVKNKPKTKRVLAMMFTAKICDGLEYSVGEILTRIEGASFYSEEVAQFYNRNGKLPTARQIAQMCDVTEQSVSRTYKNFIDKFAGKC